MKLIPTWRSRTTHAAAWKKSITASQRSAASMKIIPDPGDLYNYTSGRWLWNEALQLSRRYMEFDHKALAKRAAKVLGSQSCQQLEKLAEGQFNKVFLLTMDDGQEVVAKLPNPNAGQKHYTTASEVATMDYLRNVLGLPVPKVYGWNSDENNPVGAEYIFMEKARGVALSTVWNEMVDLKKASIVQKLADFETIFASANFQKYGSLYYADDVAKTNTGSIIEPSNGKTFVVGPTTDRSYFDHGRSEVEVSRGPWSTLQEYISAIAQRELACAGKFDHFPNQQGFYNGPGQYVPTSETKVRVLEQLCKVIPYLSPQNAALAKPAFWHTDLHGDNIFVDEADHGSITAILDWQAVHLAPLFIQAQHPTFLEFEGPVPDGYNSAAITLPQDFETLSDEQKKAAKKLRSSQLLWKLYELQLLTHGGDIKKAITFAKSLEGSLPRVGGIVFTDGELHLESLLIQLQDKWELIAGSPAAFPCPLHFTEEEREIHEREYGLFVDSVSLMADFLSWMGQDRGWEGWISHEQYEWGKRAMSRFKEDFLSRHAPTVEDRAKWLEVWPFRD